VTEDKLAYETKEYRGHFIRAYYFGNDSHCARVEVRLGESLVWQANVPAYRIWNYYAHKEDIIDDILGCPKNGQEG
jgi:hypothetical protein